MFHFLRLGRLTWYGDWVRSCLDRTSVIVYWILNNRLDDGVRIMFFFFQKNFRSFSLYTSVLCSYGRLWKLSLLARMNSVNLQLVNVIFVNPLLIRMTLATLKLVRITFVNSAVRQLERMTLCIFSSH